MTTIVKPLMRWNIDTVIQKKFRAYDIYGNTTFELTAGTWTLRKVSDGSIVLSGANSVNNSDTDIAGNTIKTVSLTVDLRQTDPHPLGTYYLIVQTELLSQQTDFHRFSVEMIDVRTRGVE